MKKKIKIHTIRKTMELRFDTFEWDELAQAVQKFLVNNKIDKVTINYWDGAVDDEIAKEVPTSAVAQKPLRFFEDDVLHFWFEVLTCRFNFDGSEFWITYPETLDDRMNIFREGDFS